MWQSLKGEEGWTFLETLIAIAVIVTLTGTVGVVGLRFLSEAKRLAARSQIESYALALNAYAMDCGTVPTEGQGLEALWKRPVLEPVPDGWDGPYVSGEIVPDPWGQPYHYDVPGPEGLRFAVVSFGADGRPGGRDDAADVVSWKR
jgi:general secretion pathway protein G